MTTTLYGIPNCDTVKKARAWLDEHGHAYRFHDFKKEGVPADRLDAWLAAAPDRVLNRKGTAWRKLDPATQAAADTPAGLRALLREHSSTIKRPVVEWPGGAITVGFDADDWAGRV